MLVSLLCVFFWTKKSRRPISWISPFIVCRHGAGLSSCLVENFEHLHVGKDVKLWPNDLTTTWKPGMYSSSHNSIELRKRLKAVDESPATPKAAAAARLKTYLQSLL